MLRCLNLLLILVGLQGLLAMPPPMDDEDDTMQDTFELSKRAFRPVPFPCNGYDYIPRCTHGGKGPRKTWTKSGRYCICLCPKNWIGPECGYHETMGKFLK